MNVLIRKVINLRLTHWPVDFEVKRPYDALTRERRAIQKMKNSDSHIREVAEA